MTYFLGGGKPSERKRDKGEGDGGDGGQKTVKKARNTYKRPLKSFLTSPVLNKK